ncbi:unnamed protein product [Schistosoma curassoni]|uniref:GRAM domain-containing protein n=1 Tax=Schistosoma curassoni TaxID=6186 RepID=A0A183K131_9TREM|nr:unnamed protein product [Schistosoma curassoni]
MIQDSEPQKLLSSNADPVRSSAMQKKIRQKYFKNDAVIKAYKCDLMSQNINTPVKLYVCHSALNLVHRPKRKILETYTLANFERSDSAIAFLRNYWEVILKEKVSFYVFYYLQMYYIYILLLSLLTFQCFSTSCGSSPANRLFVNNNNNTNDPLAHPNAIISDLYNRLLISKGSTTVSLTSTSGGATGSISNSETESVVGVKKQESSIRKLSLNVRKPSPIGFNQLNEEITNKNVDIGSNVVTQRNDDFNATSPIVNNLYSTSTPSNIPMKRNNTSVYQHTKPYNNETVNTNNINNSNKFNLNRPNVSSSSSSLIILPFILLIFFSSLGFLFLSTIHLYHRLALIDLQTGPAIRRAGMNHPSSTSTSELHNLEVQLTHLTQLASKMVETLGHLTSELNSFVLYSNPEKFSPDQSTMNT